MGPYASEDEARSAIELSRKKNELADEADRAWKEG